LVSKRREIISARDVKGHGMSLLSSKVLVMHKTDKMNRKAQLALAIIVLLALLSGGYRLYLNEQGNFHAITQGEAYRSAQLDIDEFEYYVKKHNIRSIINLRGENPRKQWYREEITFCDANNIKHYDISLSSSKAPSEEDVRRLVEIFHTAPRPVLIHCLAGADRSGLVAAMWKVIVDKEPKSEAEKQLSLFFGHFPIGKTAAMDRFFQSWDPEVK
jgi:protein tyrosine/serine phosphatase